MALALALARKLMILFLMMASLWATPGNGFPTYQMQAIGKGVCVGVHRLSIQGTSCVSDDNAWYVVSSTPSDPAFEVDQLGGGLSRIQHAPSLGICLSRMESYGQDGKIIANVVGELCDSNKVTQLWSVTWAPRDDISYLTGPLTIGDSVAMISIRLQEAAALATKATYCLNFFEANTIYTISLQRCELSESNLNNFWYLAPVWNSTKYLGPNVLPPNLPLPAGVSITSLAGRFTLRVAPEDGVLRLHDNLSGRTLWNSDNSGAGKIPGANIFLTPGGNLVLFGNDSLAIAWASNTGISGPSGPRWLRLIVEDNGDVAIYYRQQRTKIWTLWSTKTAMDTYTIRGSSLKYRDQFCVNQQLRSPTGRFTLDFNGKYSKIELVEHNARKSVWLLPFFRGSISRWEIKTTSGVCAVIEEDGSLALYKDDFDSVVWAHFGTSDSPHSLAFAEHREGVKLVMYDTKGNYPYSVIY